MGVVNLQFHLVNLLVKNLISRRECFGIFVVVVELGVNSFISKPITLKKLLISPWDFFLPLRAVFRSKLSAVLRHLFEI